LDAAPWDSAEQERVIDEVLRAYRFNTELFEDLARAKGVQVA
jgi:heme oxygenase